jgi:hypothetical protein
LGVVGVVVVVVVLLLLLLMMMMICNGFDPSRSRCN